MAEGEEEENEDKSLLQRLREAADAVISSHHREDRLVRGDSEWIVQHFVQVNEVRRCRARQIEGI